MKSGSLLVTAFLLLSLASPAQEVGAVTVVEGSLRLIRGATVLRAAAGVRLHAGDIVESSDSGFLQLEFNGGTIVALGPASRLFLLHCSGRAHNNPGDNSPVADLVILRGWLKGETNSGSGAYRYESPLLAATTGGTVVLHAAAESSELFVESGSANVGEISHEGALGHATTAKAGQFLTRRAGKAMVAGARPESAFLENMPRSFRDTLPARMSVFAGKPVQPKPDHQVSYAEVQPWLTMGRDWRRGFVERFQSRLEDDSFRRAVQEHIEDHPEWDPVLHPDKYPSKPTAAAGRSSDSSYGR